MRCITWLELAFSAAATEPHKPPPTITIQPVLVDTAKPWYGIVLRGRWLCGNHGLLTYFDTLAAVKHFLRQLKIEHFELVHRFDSDNPPEKPYQCLRLAGNRLVAAQKMPRASDRVRTHKRKLERTPAPRHLPAITAAA